MKKCYLESMSRGISYMKYGKGRLTGLVTYCLIRQVIEGKMKGEMEMTRRRGRRQTVE